MSGAELAVALGSQAAWLVAYVLHVASLGRLRASRGAWAVTLGTCALALAAGWLGEDLATWALTGALSGAARAGGALGRRRCMARGHVRPSSFSTRSSTRNRSR